MSPVTTRSGVGYDIAVSSRGVSSIRFRLLVSLFAALALLGVAAGQASASPGAYRVLIVEADEKPPLELQKQLAAFPDVASVEILDAGEEGGTETPTAAKLEGYDLVISMSDDRYLDPTAYGNALADYVDSGGVVVQYAYDNWEGAGSGQNGPAGRFESGGYPPFVPGSNPNNPALTLGSFDSASPLMEGVSALQSDGNTEPTLAPGATSVAKWSNGKELVAYKGRVVSISANVAGESTWSGDFARLTVNAVRWLGRHTLTVANSNPAGGTVTSSTGGISCGSTCSAAFVYQAPVSLAAAASPGFAFGGFSGACTGTSCSLTMDATKSVSANFFLFSLGKKTKLNKKKGTGLLAVNLGGAGSVALSGAEVKVQSKTVLAAGKVLLPILPNGKVAKKLKKRGKAKVKFDVTFTPSDGSAANLGKTVLLRSSSSSK